MSRTRVTLADRLAGAGRWVGRGVRLAAARFPAAAAAIVAISALCNLAVADAMRIEDADLAWLIAALFSGAAVSVGAALAAEAARLSWASTQGIATAAAIGAGLLVWFGDALGLFAPAFVAGAVLLVPFAAFLRAVGRSDIAFWSFTLWAAVGAALAFLSVLLFVLGLSAILEMIRFLLEIGLSSDAYEHIYVTAFTLVGPLFALGQIPRLSEHESAFASDDRLLVGVRVLFDWVATPLTLATALVLHLYAAKITLQGVLPVNEIGWIVTFYAVLLLSLRIAVAPYVAFGAWPTRVLARWWWALLVVPLGLLALAVSLRVLGEGWTSDRYYLTLGGLAAGLAVILQVPRRLRGSIVAIGVVPGLLLLLSSFGPWGVGAVVARSQGGIVAERFTEGGRLLSGDRLTPDRAGELRSRLSALAEVGGLGVLAPLAGSSDLAASLEASSWTGEDDALLRLTEALGLGYGAAPVGAARLGFSASASASIDTAGFDRVAVDRYTDVAVSSAARPAPGPAGAGLVRMALVDGDLEVSIDGVAARFELAPALRALPQAIFSSDSAAVPPQAVDLVDREGRRHLRLVLTMATIAADRSQADQLSGTVLYRAGEWRP